MKTIIIEQDIDNRFLSSCCIFRSGLTGQLSVKIPVYFSLINLQKKKIQHRPNQSRPRIENSNLIIRAKRHFKQICSNVFQRVSWPKLRQKHAELYVITIRMLCFPVRKSVTFAGLIVSHFNSEALNILLFSKARFVKNLTIDILGPLYR